MNEEQVRAIAQQVYDMNATSDQFAVGQVSFHTHNDIDSNALTFVTLAYGGKVNDPGAFFGTVSAPFIGGETSATLTSNWQFFSGVYTTEFSNGDVFPVTYTAGSTTITWGTPLSGAATTHLVITGVGATPTFLPRGWTFAQAGIGFYTITHNLNTDFYGVVATSSDISTLSYAVSACFKNYFTLSFIDSSLGVATSTSFAFMLLAVTNKAPGFPQYQLN